MTSSGPVYSTEYGRMCPACGMPVAQCLCRRKTTAPVGDGIVRVNIETKGRKGRGVTVIKGVPLDEKKLKGLGKQLKAKFGTGGTVKDGVIEIQGEHGDALLNELRKHGWTVKRL
jgi:translation initiation factor 1